jgi:hypothetical protein
MLIQEKLLSYWKYLRRNWSAILATISIMGVIVCHFLPFTRNYVSFFIFLGINAVVWTLIEIKILLTEDISLSRYDDLRLARPHIMNKIRKAITRAGKSGIEIIMVGGRIRTISDMITEIKNDIVNGKIAARNVSIVVYCRYMGLLSNEIANRDNIQGGSRREFQQGDQLVAQFTGELQSYNELPEFKNNNIVIQIIQYTCIPRYYLFRIGESQLFWGCFTWNNESRFFEGPGNPCYYLSRNSIQFDDYSGYMNNWVEYLQLTAITPVS